VVVTRLLLDENVSPGVAEGLRAHGHDAVHVNDVGLRATPDAAIMLWAAERGRVVVTHDHDFLDNLRALRAGAPSVIKLAQSGGRGLVGHAEQTAHLARVLPSLDRQLRSGVVAILDRSGVSTSALPLARQAARVRAPEGRAR
jgi:predicted nuclease of predicted toxin-antitoxin system